MASQVTDIERVSPVLDRTIDKEAQNPKTINGDDADMALRVYSNADCTEEEIAAVDEKKLLRKIDFHLIPIVSPRTSLLLMIIYICRNRCLLP
jgi:hypothetical protein